MNPTLLDNVMKCLHLPNEGKGGGVVMRDYYDTATIAFHAIKHAPLPR